MPSPLFQLATKAIRAAAQREFAATAIGKLAETAARERIASRTLRPSAGSKLQQAMDQFNRIGAAGVLRQIAGTHFGQFARQAEHYAKRGNPERKLLEDFLKGLGPTGSLLRELAMPGGRGSSLDRSLQAATSLLRAFGGGTLSPLWASTEQIRQSMADAQTYLEHAGFQVLPPAAADAVTKAGAERKADAARERRSTIDVLMGDNSTRRFPKTHPIATGEMLAGFKSSNVYAFGYDQRNAFLYVRFKDREDDNNLGGPGPIYLYRDVPPEIFLKMMAAPSKGTFIWDSIRYRGTVSGHRYDYALVGVQGGYVPRKAVLTARGEEYQPRMVKSLSANKWLRSRRGAQLVRPLRPG